MLFYCLLFTLYLNLFPFILSIILSFSVQYQLQLFVCVSKGKTTGKDNFTIILASLDVIALTQGNKKQNRTTTLFIRNYSNKILHSVNLNNKILK